MEPCNACKTLSGKLSSTPPHGDLYAMGRGIFGYPSHPTKRYDQYRCTVCGNWMHRCTHDGDPPGVWSLRDAGAEPTSP